MTTAAVIIAVSLSLSAFDYRSEGGGGLFPYECAASEREALVNTANPSSLPFQKGFFCASQAENPYGIAGLISCGAEAGYGAGDYGVSAAWSRFGIQEYFEDRTFLSAGKSFGRTISSGVRLHADKLSLNTDVCRSTQMYYDADAAFRSEPLPFFALGFVQRNIGSLAVKKNRDMLYPETALGAAVFPAQGLSLSWNYNRTFYGGVNSIACSVYLLPQLMIGGGYSKETERYAVQTALLVKGMRISYTFSFHPSLGTTHGVSVSWSPSSDVYRSVDAGCNEYPALSGGGGIVVDIAHCSSEELAEAAGITEEISGRIVRYRELFGKVTEKALFQVGLTPAERTAVTEHASGIETEQEEKTAAFAQKAKDKNMQHSAAKTKTKDLFLRCIDAGVAPSKALKAAAIAKKSEGEDLVQEIRKSAEFTAEEKKRIIGVCSGR